MIGTVIADRYEVVRVIGEGSHGAVCEVVDRTSGETAALKMLVGKNEELAARLEREAKALSVLGHPNVVALVDSGRKEDGSPYVVTELIRGVSLRDVIDQGALAPRRALVITRQLLEALHHAHAAGIIHRDVKPENVMLANGGEPGRDYVKLIDFGVAKMVDPTTEVLGNEKLTRAGLEVIGSPCYIAPEITIGEPTDVRADLYSLGIVVFEMLNGEVPFVHDDTRTLLRMQVTDPVPPLNVGAPDGTSTEELEAIVKKALAKEPAQRFASAMDMHAAVTAAIVPTPRPVARPVAPTKIDRVRQAVRNLMAFAKRRPQVFAAGATALVVLVLFIVIASGRSSSPEREKPEKPVVASGSSAPVETPVPATQWVQQAESEIARRRYGRAIAAYERALVADRALAKDPKLRTAVVQIAEGGDAIAAVIALDVLASRLEPPGRATILEQASNGKVPEVRRRAFAIAERDGFAISIDRLASWTLDLKQQSATCEDRRETVMKLRDLGDASVVEALQKAQKQYPCVAKDAAAAITHLQTPK